MTNLIKHLTIAAAIFLTSAYGYSQGYTLKYSSALKVSNSLVTVPEGKVWKVTSVYGSDRICLPCIINEHYTHSYCSGRYIDYVGTSFYVDGTEIISFREWKPSFSTTDPVYSDSNCTTLYANLTVSGNSAWRLFDVSANPNMLPMWLSAGTTVRTSTPNIFLSILEFDVQP